MLPLVVTERLPPQLIEDSERPLTRALGRGPV